MKKFTLSFVVILLFVLIATATCTEEVKKAETPKATTTTKTTTTQPNGEKHQFQAEISKLLGIIINSLYTDKEIFLRELISNASDALDKIRYKSLTDKKAFATNPKLEIRIQADPKRKTLTITDSGVGMTKKELVENLGTLAKSGTKAFIEKLKKTSDYSLIGKFGVGFYSAFVVADKVTVASKANEDAEQYVWESEADNAFTVYKDPRGNTLKRGTEITLFLKEKVGKEYLDQYELKRLISKYSQFTHFPIYLYTERTETKEVPVELTEEEKKAEADAEAEKKKAEEEKKKNQKEGEENIEIKKEEKKEEEKKPKTKKVEELIKEWKHVNDVKPVWTREPASITQEEYNTFYKGISRDYMDPLTHIHFKQEGSVDFKALLYVPLRAPFDAPGAEKQDGKIKLYVRRVFIKELGENFIPRYLGWLTGVIDSEDLPLHISRQDLQRTKILDVIKRRVVKKTLQMLSRLAQEEEELLSEYEKDVKAGKKDVKKPETKYTNFYNEFEKSIKLGVIEDEDNKKKIVDLLRFKTSESPDKLISFETYVSRMKKDQKKIYYLSAASENEAKNSPYLERLKGFEVIFFSNPIDEYMLPKLKEYGAFSLQDISKEDLEATSGTSKEDLEKLKKDYEKLTSKLKEVLDNKVEKVVVNDGIKTSPAVLVAGSTGITANMERIMRAQTMADPRRFQYMEAKKVLEINPSHSVISELNKLLEKGNDEKVKKYGILLYETALLRSGYIVDDTKNFASRIFDMMNSGLTANEEISKENLKKKEFEKKDQDAKDEL